MSKNNYIYYGDGDIRIESSSEISAFDIKLDGTYNLESYNPTNFLINYHKGRVVGVGLGSTLGESAFLKYTGDLKIQKCVVIKDSREKVFLKPLRKTLHTFSAVENDFDGENLKFENLDYVGIVGKIPNKTTVKIITKNLTATIGQYTLNGGDYVGDYHLHHTGVAMTGADHTEDSEVLIIKNKIKIIRNIRNAVRKISASSSTGGY